ncbi:hypothetical protein AB4Y32_37660 [Paraburkholderia phymatum]|uniref:Uncharacterized protein n=1 Tax=Paraburkholderia phymatum TaxID=148447 RepID=A0ACC6UCM5_9BURK
MKREATASSSTNSDSVYTTILANSKRRVLALGAILFGVLFIFGLILSNSEGGSNVWFSIFDNAHKARLASSIVFVASLFSLLVSFGLGALLYLQTGFRRPSISILGTTVEIPSSIESETYNRSLGQAYAADVIDDFGNVVSTPIAGSDRSLDSHLAVDQPQVSTLKDKVVERQFEQSRARLSREIASLQWRGNLNLVLGILVSVSGMSILGIFLLSSNLQIGSISAGGNVTIAPNGAKAFDEAISFLIHFLPRLTFVLLIELFAYFFLKLYKNSLSEIKYFQNEITNIEAKHLALRAAFLASSATLSNKVISSLVDTERNYILEKGQTTVDLERSRIDREQWTDVCEDFFFDT